MGPSDCCDRSHADDRAGNSACKSATLALWSPAGPSSHVARYFPYWPTSRRKIRRRQPGFPSKRHAGSRSLPPSILNGPTGYFSGRGRPLFGGLPRPDGAPSCRRPSCRRPSCRRPSCRRPSCRRRPSSCRQHRRSRPCPDLPGSPRWSRALSRPR